MSQIFQSLISSWSIPFFMGWSLMKLFNLAVVLFILGSVIIYFYDVAKR